MTTDSKIPSRRPRPLALFTAAVLAVLAGCDDAATTAVVENAFPAASDADSTTPTPIYAVYKVWWAPTLFRSPVAAGETSETERTVPGTGSAYALLAPGWSPADGGRPPRLVAVKSARELSVAAHGLLRIVVSDETFTGDCASGPPLDADDAQLIVERIFPGDFAGSTYDPATCTTTPAGAQGRDGGAADGG